MNKKKQNSRARLHTHTQRTHARTLETYTFIFGSIASETATSTTRPTTKTHRAATARTTKCFGSHTQKEQLNTACVCVQIYDMFYMQPKQIDTRVAQQIRHSLDAKRSAFYTDPMKFSDKITLLACTIHTHLNTKTSCCILCSRLN